MYITIYALMEIKQTKQRKKLKEMYFYNFLEAMVGIPPHHYKEAKFVFQRTYIFHRNINNL